VLSENRSIIFSVIDDKLFELLSHFLTFLVTRFYTTVAVIRSFGLNLISVWDTIGRSSNIHCQTTGLTN